MRMPPLRRRPEDIPLLVRRLLDGKVASVAELQGGNLRKLMAYSWPGNIRELRNVLDRACALAQAPGQAPPAFEELVFNLGGGESEPVSLGISYPGVTRPMRFKEAKELLLGQFERAYVEALMVRHGGNVSRAAEAAGLSRKHLYELLRRVRGQQEEEGS